MFKNIIIGQYIHGTSPLHRMDARIKILITLAYIVMLFVFDSLPALIIMCGFMAVVMMMSQVPIKFIIRGLRPMAMIFAFTALFNLFLTPGERLCGIDFGSLWSLEITKEGVYASIVMLVRLLFLVSASSMLTLTTPPLMLTDGIENLLKPLTVIKVPAHEIAMMMTIAIRFIPTLAEETDKIMKAQTARGADFESGNILKRAKAMIPILVPLFVSAFRRADELATAMEARCYRGGENRTKLKQSHITRIDICASSVFVVVCVAAGVLGAVL